MYKRQFPDFLERFAPLSHLRYLGDVARLEQAQREAYHAADRAPVEADRLERLSPDLMAQARLELAPALRVLRSPWPVHGIWRYACDGGAPKPSAVAEDVLITRPEFDPVVQLLPPGGAVFVTALLSAQSLSDAVDAALGEAQDFDLAGMLSLLLTGRAITAIFPPKEQAT